MPRFTVRTAAVVAIASLSLSASTGVASAAAGKGKHKRASVGHVVLPSGGGAPQELSAHATGDGPATQADCDRYTAAIASWEQAADEAFLNGNDGGWTTAINYAVALTDQAMDEGCFIIY